MSELKETRKMKVVQLHEFTPKQCLNPSQPPKIAPKIKSKSNVRIERNKENESCSITGGDLKTVVAPYSNPKISPLGPKK